MNPNSRYEYITSSGAKLFTAILLSNDKGESFPIVVMRSPYVDFFEEMDEKDMCERYLLENERFLRHGYGVVIQHCRDRGKSDGDFIPYINEHEDSNCLYNWICSQEFYGGELFLFGGELHRLGASLCLSIR